MSRVIWGHGKHEPESNNKLKQRTLDGFLIPSRRERTDDDDVHPPLPEMSAPTQLSMAHDAGDDGTRHDGGHQHRQHILSAETAHQRAVPVRSVSASSSSHSSNVAVAMMMRGSMRGAELPSSSSPAAAAAASVTSSAAGGGGSLVIAGEQGEDGVQWGPSGGGNRETMQRRRMRPFMDGKERSSALDQSPYSRGFMSEWKHMRAETAPATTELDPAIIASRFVAPDCPRNLFAGKVFFLNSCDSDALVSVYQLEKVIRYLGGTTAMGVSKQVDYIVTQHLSSAKSKLLEAGRVTKPVHPHFVLACAKAGSIVPIDKYLLQKDVKEQQQWTSAGKSNHQPTDDVPTAMVKSSSSASIVGGAGATSTAAAIAIRGTSKATAIDLS